MGITISKVEEKENYFVQIYRNPPYISLFFSRTILSTENQSGVSQKKTITITEGVTRTDTHETKISVTTTREISAAYEIISTKESTTISREWKVSTQHQLAIKIK